MPSSTEAIILARVNQKIHATGDAHQRADLHDDSHLHTVTTLLRNVALYNAGARGEVEKELEQAIPSLLEIGLIGLFSPEEWCSGTNLGRQFVGLKAQVYLAAKIKLHAL